MKKIVLLIALIITNIALCEMFTGTINQAITTGNITEIQQLHWASDSKSYINGGIDFTYPSNLFSSAPHVTISIESSQSLIIYSAKITTNSATSTTINVVNDSILGVVDANTDAVIVHLFAIGS